MLPEPSSKLYSTMSFSKFACSLYLLSFILLSNAASRHGDSLYYFCSIPDQNFTAGDPYDTNQQELASYLSYKTPFKGFGLGSRGKNPYKVYGLALCCIDVLGEACWGCVDNASKEIRNYCPNSKGASIWYDKCFFKYSKESFFGKVSSTAGMISCNHNNVSESTSFNEAKTNLWSRLANETLRSQKLYAWGSSKLKGSDKVYGLTQCTRDFSSSDCGVCLDVEIMELSLFCDGKQGGIYLGESCTVRFEMYEFLNTTNL